MSLSFLQSFDASIAVLAALAGSTIKVSIILLVALAATFKLRRRSAALRHWVLSLAIVCALATPLLSLVLPAWSVEAAALWQPAWLGRIVSAASPLSAADRVNTSESLRLDSATPASAANGAAGAHARSIAAAVPGTPSGAAAWLARTARDGSWLAIALVLLPIIWIAGVLACAISSFAGLARLRWLAARSRRVTCGPWREITDAVAATYGLRKTAVHLLHSDHARLLVTWGHFHPRVLLPAAASTWSPSRMRIVISHELAHVRRGDWATQMTAEALRVLFWFNPFVWIVCRRLRAESELACDDEVLRRGVGGTEYAGHLVDLARLLNDPRPTLSSAPAMARPSSLEGRISAMLNSRLERRPVSRAARAATAFVLLALTLAVAASAQSTFYTFSGTVLDSSDRVIAGVDLVLTSRARGARYELRSDASGRFEFVGLPAGDYGLEVTREGFDPFKETIAIAGGNVTNRRIVLQIGTLREVISIEGAGTTSTTLARYGAADDAAVAAARERFTAACMPDATVAGGRITAPHKLVDLRPNYPEALSSASVGGTVMLEALVDTAGDVEDLHVVSSPDPGLSAAAMDAVRGWQYTPTLLNCAAVPVRISVSVSFTPKPTSTPTSRP